jgi:hypothetical protein
MTASTKTAAFNATADLLSDSANTINAERLKGAALRSFRKSINATAKAVAAATEAEHLYTWSSFYHYSDRLEVTITGQLNGLDSLKDKRLFDALDTIERKTGAQFADSKDDLYYEAPTREFIAALTVTPPTPHSAAAKLLLLTIRVVASVRGDSESCRRVQTGVTMRETPVYAIQCD